MFKYIHIRQQHYFHSQINARLILCFQHESNTYLADLEGVPWNPLLKGCLRKFFAQTYYIHYAHTRATQKPQLHNASVNLTLFRLISCIKNSTHVHGLPWHNLLLCSLCGLKQSPTFNSVGFKLNN